MPAVCTLRLQISENHEKLLIFTTTLQFYSLPKDYAKLLQEPIPRRIYNRQGEFGEMRCGLLIDKNSVLL
jgi:hypothetical protein